MKRLTLAVCLLALAAGAQARTWTFRRDGQIQAPGGATSFRKGGRINADLVRVDGTNVILRLALNGKDGVVPLDSLSDADRAYLNGNPKIVPATSEQAKPNTNEQAKPNTNEQAKPNANEQAKPNASQQANTNDFASYIKSNAGDLINGISQNDFPKTDKGLLACKEILSELRQVDKALREEISCERFGGLLQEKTLAVEKVKDLRGEDIPGVFLKHADLCLKGLNRSTRYWRDEIKADDKDSKAFYAYVKRWDWEQSTIDLLYCVAIAEKDVAVMQKIFAQKALIIQHEQAAIKEGILSTSVVPLLPPMTQEEIAARLKSAVESVRSNSK